jgi:conjugal transfer ATP-binding protein TraC
MAYEIPQQLQHKEKIVFGLTFSQLGWVLLFGFVLLIIFKSDLSLNAKFILALFPTLLGVLFVFFNLNKWLKHLSSYLKFRSANLDSPNMKNLIEVKKIDENKIHTDQEIAVLQITPLNFSIKTKDEKENIIYGFQRFLNGLDFPVQFVVTTHNLNIDNYLDNLEKRATNPELFKDFSDFMKDNIKNNEMRNRSFYLIIPKKSDLEIQCNVCKERLQGIGLKVRRLDDKEILNNLYLFFNDVTDKREEKENINNPLHYLIAPNYIKDNVESLTLNNKQCRIISAIGYPRMVESGFLDKIISTNDDFDISIHIEPFPIETMMLMLNREIQKQRADLFAEQKKNSINPSLEIKLNDTRKVLEALQKGQQKLFNVSLYINCKGKNKEELDFLTKKVEAELNSIMVVPSIPYFRQIQGYKSMMPLAKDELKIKRNITTDALSAFFPFTSPFLTLEEKGVMLGLNKNKVPFIKDIYGLSNANGVVLATSGSGKSYFTKLLISRQLLNNTQVLIIDPQAEYIGLTGHCKGELITISKNSKTIINPLDLMGHDYVEKRLMLMDMFKIMFGDLSEIQKSILDKAITETYAKKGITINSNKYKKMPVLGDLYKVLLDMDKKASQMEKVTYRALINRLYMYTEGVFSFMNKPTSIDFDNDFVCFNIGDMPKQVKPLVMFLILDFVYMRMKQSKQRKLLIIDEAWSLLGHAEEADYIFEIVKTCRKYNMGLLLITQDVADLINSKAGHAVLANSSYSLLLRQKPSVIDSVVKTFHLSQMEKEYLLTATQGRGILIMDNEHQELEVVASPKEHSIITTNPNDTPKPTPKPEKNEVDINIKLDLNKGLFFGKELDIEEKNYLTNHGYKVGSFVPIGKPRQEECWVKENKKESLAHTFLVHNIKQEIQNFVKDIEVNIVEKPDITFKTKAGKEVAIEVETGSSYKKNKKKLIQKFSDLRYQYQDRLLIVLTDKDFKARYEALFPSIKIMLRRDVAELISTLKKR